MVIIIDEPKGKAYYGGTVAAPVFRQNHGRGAADSERDAGRPAQYEDRRRHSGGGEKP